LYRVGGTDLYLMRGTPGPRSPQHARRRAFTGRLEVPCHRRA